MISANYALSGLVDWRLAGLLLFGGIVGGVIGLSIAKRLSVHALLARRLSASLILLVAAYVAIRALGAA